MRLTHALAMFALLSLGALWMYVTNNPDDPLAGAMATASLWLLAVAGVSLALLFRMRKRG